MTTPTHLEPEHTHGTGCWWHPDEARWVCRPDRSATAGRPLVDVRDMLVVHTALLREFRLMPAAVSSVDEHDVGRAALVDRHLRFLCAMLHHHHEGEDTLLWPLLRQRLAPAAQLRLDAVEAQHGEIDAALSAVAEARAGWVGVAGSAGRRRLVADLQLLHALLTAHLELEESSVLPLAAIVLTEVEWDAVGEAAAAAMSKPDLVLAIGMFAYEGDPAVLRRMLASAPAVPRVLVPRIGPRVYARRARQVYGTARP